MYFLKSLDWIPTLTHIYPLGPDYFSVIIKREMQSIIDIRYLALKMFILSPEFL